MLTIGTGAMIHYKFADTICIFIDALHFLEATTLQNGQIYMRVYKNTCWLQTLMNTPVNPQQQLLMFT